MKRVALAASVLLACQSTDPEPKAPGVSEGALTVKDSGSWFAKTEAEAEVALAPLVKAESAYRAAMQTYVAAINRRLALLRAGNRALAFKARLKKRGVVKDLTPLQKVADSRADAAAKENASIDAAKKAVAGAKSKFDAELATAQAKAKKELEAKNGSAYFALHVACIDYTHRVSLPLRSLRTPLWRMRMTGAGKQDALTDGMLLDMCRSVAREESGALQRSVNRLQTQLSIISIDQLRSLEGAMVKEIQGAIDRTAPSATLFPMQKSLFAARFKQIVAVPLVLIGDQTRHLPSFKKPALNWLASERKLLAKYVRAEGSILHRSGLFVYDERRHAVIPVTSKAQLAPANTKIFRGAQKSKYLKFSDGKGGETSNGLAAFIESLGQACRAHDLVPSGKTAKTVDGYTCDPGCNKGVLATPSTLQASWGLAGLKPSFGDTAPYRADLASCTPPPGSGTSGGTSSDDNRNGSARGSIGGLAGGKKSCTMQAISDATAERTSELQCLAATFPNQRGLGTIGDAPSGGHGCRPGVAGGGVADGEPDSEYGNYTTAYVDEEGRTWDVFSDDEGNATYVYTDENGQDTVVRAGEDTGFDDVEKGMDHAVETGHDTNVEDDGSYTDVVTGENSHGNDTSGTGTDESQGTTSANDWEDAQGGAGPDGPSLVWFYPAMVLDAILGPFYDVDWGQAFNCNVTGECTTDLQSCDVENQTCGDGCTGNDAVFDSFQQCVTDAATKNPQPSNPLDPYINPAPDAGSFDQLTDPLLACLAGGQASVETCRGSEFALCSEDKPNCMCDTPQPAVPPTLSGMDCELAMCANNMATGEQATGTIESGSCGCQSVLGGP